ncbi:MAG: hypothetical protein GWN86_14410, partial [Desulfobacterales bacterium]|nr:hypothetical protein [Desulfobacterales bacterium]
MLIQNPGFEDGLVGWRVESLAGRDDQFQPANEEVEVVSTQALQGGASLKLRVFSDNQGNCLEGPRRARQFLSPNDGMAMTAPSNHVTVFARGWRWDTPSR